MPTYHLPFILALLLLFSLPSSSSSSSPSEKPLSFYPDAPPFQPKIPRPVPYVSFPRYSPNGPPTTCINQFWGGTSNRVISLANFLGHAIQRDTERKKQLAKREQVQKEHEINGGKQPFVYVTEEKQYVLNGGWGWWYQKYFEVHPLLLFDVEGIQDVAEEEKGSRKDWYSGCCMEWCKGKVGGNILYYERSLNELNPYIKHIKLRRDHVARAEFLISAIAAMDIQNKSRVVTVHSRALHKSCRARTKHTTGFCGLNFDPAVPNIGIPEYMHTCNYTEESVRELLPQALKDAPLVLLGDRENKKSEGTFSIRGNEHFGVELAMMTMSTYHVGVPASSVDYVVYHWRQDRKEVQSQWPEKCYDYSITGGPTKKDLDRRQKIHDNHQRVEKLTEKISKKDLDEEKKEDLEELEERLAQVKAQLNGMEKEEEVFRKRWEEKKKISNGGEERREGVGEHLRDLIEELKG